MKISTQITSRLTVAVLCSLIMFSAASRVAAQDSFQLDVSISPSVSFLKLQPGSSAVYAITVENTGSKQVTLKPTIVDFKSDNLTGVPVLTRVLTFPYFEDIDTLPTLTLKPGETAQAQLNMTIPAGAPNAEYPMTILFETPEDSVPTLPGQVGSQAQIGSNLIILVTNETETPTDVSIDSLQTSPFIDSFRPITFSPLVRNNSFAGTVASGSAEIKNWRGATVAEFNFPEQVVLGNSTRGLLVVTPESILTSSTGEAAPQLTLAQYKTAFLLGPYWIKSSIVAGPATAQYKISETTLVVSLPFSIIIAAGIISIIWLIHQWHERNKIK